MDYKDDILFENLADGAYILTYESGQFEENVKYASADFNRLYTRRVRLPDGKGNVIYLMTNTFENSLKLLDGKFFILPSTYKRIFFPKRYIGRFMGKRISINVNPSIKERKKLISSTTKLIPYQTNFLSPSMDNVVFTTGDIVSSAMGIMSRFSAKRNYMEFYSQYISILDKLTPSPKQESKDPGWNNRVLVIDCDAFTFKTSGSLDENKTNPLYLLYLAYLRTRDLSKLNVDMDMMIISKNLFLKFNPKNFNQNSQWTVFKRALFRMMNVDLDEYTDGLNDEDKASVEETDKTKQLSNIVDETIAPYTKNVSSATKTTLANAVQDKFTKQAATVARLDKEVKATQKEMTKVINAAGSNNQDVFKKSISDANPSILHANPVANPLTSKQEKLLKTILGDYAPLATTSNIVIDDDEDDDKPVYDEDEFTDEEEEGIADDITEILAGDEEVLAEVLDDIQDRTAPLDNPKTAPINSARDKKLREEQKKVVVKNSTIEEVLARDASNVPIKTTDKSAVMHTSNRNMQVMTFTNFNKTYIDELYVKDLVACFDALKDKSTPFYITGIDIKDTSDTLNLQETWTVHLVDETKKRHTVKVDIPKFIDDRFMLIKGTKYVILNQNFYNPLVKDTPDTVIVTTNFHKITIQRKATKSLSTIERIFSLIKKTGDSKIFTSGDSTKGNLKYISSLEYDELARRLFKFESNGCTLYFSRDYIKDIVLAEGTKGVLTNGMTGKEFFIGVEGNSSIFIDEDTGLDRSGRTISQIIEANLPDDYKALYNSIKGPTQLMYVEGKLAGEFIPIITTLIVWVGLTKSLDRMGIKWRFDPNAKKVPINDPDKRYIRFADGVLEYEAFTFAELMLNGLIKMHPEKFRFSDFESEVCYDDFIYSQWGTYNGITEIKTFYEFLVDPITKDVCRDIGLPDDPVGLLIHAVKLLADNAFVSKASDKSYRVRSIEIIPGMLYQCLALQYKAYVRYGRRVPMTLRQNCVIQKLLDKNSKTVEVYSTLNPVIEVSKTHMISTKGYAGSNSEHSYDEEKRSYDPTSVGKLAISTSADANVGINKSLVIEPTLSNARGYRDQVEDTDQLKDVNIFSPVEMLTPGTSRNEDPIRTAIATKQSQHVVPVADAAPSLVSNGYDEAVQFHLSDDFVINAEEDGKVIDVNNELGFIMVQYKSGKTKAINTKPEVVYNSGGGFYMSNQLTPVYTKVGQTFKKDEALAYHPKYFKMSKMNGLRYSIGPIVKMAMMSSYNTYEDAGICTEELAERMATSIVYQVDGRFKRNNNILSMVKIGDHVNIGDPLIRFDVSTEDAEVAKFLTKLSEDNATMIENATKNDIKADHAGKVIDIKVYTLLQPAMLSPSLATVVQQYFDKGISKKEYLEKFDSSEGIIKAGYLLTDATEPIKDKYNSIKGNKGIDVLIEIYIEHKDVMGVGDKVALYSANKQIISQVIPKGYEPYSEFRPDEEISVMTSPGTIARRMTPAVIPVSAAMKIMIELKRKIAEEIKYK